MLVVIFTQVQAQKIKDKDVPANVMSAFGKSYPTVKNANWQKTSNGFEVSYDKDEMERNTSYDANGNLIENRTKIMASGLPIAATDYMKKNHKDHKIKETYRTTDASENAGYKAKIKGLDLYFDANGNFVKSVKD